MDRANCVAIPGGYSDVAAGREAWREASGFLPELALPLIKADSVPGRRANAARR